MKPPIFYGLITAITVQIDPTCGYIEFDNEPPTLELGLKIHQPPPIAPPRNIGFGIPCPQFLQAGLRDIWIQQPGGESVPLQLGAMLSAGRRILNGCSTSNTISHSKEYKRTGFNR
jgi:hypothetical protein